MGPDASSGRADESTEDHGSGARFNFAVHIKNYQESQKLVEGPGSESSSGLLVPRAIPAESQIPFTHAYLGEMKDVPCGQAPALDSHGRCELGCFLQQCPTFPGQSRDTCMEEEDSLPQKLLQIVTSQRPNACFFVTALYPRIENPDNPAEEALGCIVRVLQISNDGRRSLIQGVCPCTFEWERDNPNWPDFCEIPVKLSAEAWPPAADADAAAKIAIRNFERNHPLVPCIDGDPLQISNWLASHMPLSFDARRLLLTECPYDRLRTLSNSGAPDNVFLCSTCRQEVADAKDLIQAVDQGPRLECYEAGLDGGPMLFGHAFICLSTVKDNIRRTMRLAPPSTCFSWFPGYAGQELQCRCDTTLGWRFTAVEANMPIQEFWGLRENFGIVLRFT